MSESYKNPRLVIDAQLVGDSWIVDASLSRPSDGSSIVMKLRSGSWEIPSPSKSIDALAATIPSIAIMMDRGEWTGKKWSGDKLLKMLKKRAAKNQ